MARHAGTPEAPFFEENGVIITRTHLTASGRKFEFAKVTFVNIQRVRTARVLGVFGGKPVLRLMVAVGNSSPEIVFETEDAAFMERIRDAMDRAARGHRQGSRAW